MKIQSLLLLQTFYFVATFGLPDRFDSGQSEEEYVIPHIPSNSRTQYYVQSDDDSFKYGYDTGSGTYEAVKKTGVDDVKGVFGFRSPDGSNTKVSYTAGGQSGFVPKFDRSASELRARSTPMKNFGLKSDSSYDFSYHNKDSSRSETADADLNVRGSYSFIADDGIERTVTYRAGPNTGFVANIDESPASSREARKRQDSLTTRLQHQPVFKYVPAREDYRSSKDLNPDGSYSFQYRNEDSSRKETADADLNVQGEYSFVADDGIKRTVKYKAGSDTGFVADADFLPKAEETPVFRHSLVRNSYPVLKKISEGQDNRSSKDLNPDGSYSFQYRNEDSSRKETADADLNVQGEYSFVADDGIKRTVKYRAGSDTGFVADADFIPTPQETPAYRHSIKYAPSLLKYAPAGEDYLSSRYLKPDGSFSFQYRNEDNYRKKIADTDGMVPEEYSFIDGDGIRRTVKYRAGSETGFVTDADFIPTPQETPVYRHSIKDSHPVLKYVPAGEDYRSAKDLKPIGSSSFQYRNEDNYRKKTADTDRIEQEEYSFIDGDGIRRTVKYRAGFDTDFVTENESLHVPQGAPTFESLSLANAQPLIRYEPANEESGDAKHASRYAYQYKPKDRSRKEVYNASVMVPTTYNFVDYRGIKKVDPHKTWSDGSLSTKDEFPLQSSLDFSQPSHRQSYFPSRGSSFQKQLVGNVLLNQNFSGAKRGYVFTEV